MKLIPLILIVSPLLGAILGKFFKKYSLFAILSSLVNLILSIYLISSMINGEIIEFTHEFSIFPIGLYFKLDLLGYIFVAIVSLVWFLATLYSFSYIEESSKSDRYYTFLMITLSSMMGVFVSGDWLSLFLFFEVMTIASYVLVVHKEDQEARNGGNYYLFMGVMGGLLILWGITFLYKFTDSILIESALIQLQNLYFLKYFIASLLIVGFGVKAGMFPVHIWLPKAHPVAPSPASALLSGIIIKAGAYGILRIITTLYWSTGHNYVESLTLQNIGLVLIVLGSITMFLGMIKALFQWNVKRMLAYSSVSQMGYILVGIGVIGYLGTHGTLGFIGALYHIINHALFKSSVFLIIGAIYYVTHKVNLKDLGGMGKRYPIIAFAFVVAAMGISGIPGFNGYISKNLIHHGLLEAIHLHGNLILIIAEKLFIITSAGTLCYFLKISYYIFLRKQPKELTNLPEIPTLMKLVTSIFAIFIIILGIIPHFIIEKLFASLYGSYNLNQDVIHHLVFWSKESLFSTGSYLIAGLIFFIIAIKYSWFDYKKPQVFNIKEIYSDLVEYLKNKNLMVDNKVNKLKKEFKVIPTVFYNTLIDVDRDPEGKSNGLTIKNIDFGKLVIASMLIFILLCFIIA